VALIKRTCVSHVRRKDDWDRELRPDLPDVIAVASIAKDSARQERNRMSGGVDCRNTTELCTNYTNAVLVR
jgi:hypothetical protein